MKLYSKFTKYLVENHPLLFHTKFFQLLLCGVLIWVGSFIAGYLLTTYSLLTNVSIEHYYFESYFVMFHILSCIILLSVWAIHFYKMKPVRNYYPLSRGYFTKLFLLLFIPVSLIISASIPFTEGIKLRTKQLLPIEKFEKDREILNLGYPFLIMNIEGYDFRYKTYPDPFPLKSFTIDVVEGVRDTKPTSKFKHKKDVVSEVEVYETYETSSDYRHYYYLPELRNQTYINRGEINEAIYILKYLEDYNPTVYFDKKKYVFYTDKKVYENSDSCNSNLIIQDFIALSPSLIKEIKPNHLLNFSEALLKTDNSKDYYKYNSYEDYDSKGKIDSNLRETVLPIIREIVLNKDFEKIKSTIRNFCKVLDKYGIKHYVNEEKLAQYIKQKNFGDFYLDIVGSYKREYYSDNEEYYNVAEGYKMLTPFEKELKNELMFFEQANLSRLNDNYYESYYKSDLSDQVYFFLIFAFILTSFTVWFEFAEIKSFLLTIPIGGALVVMVSLFVFILNSEIYLGHELNTAIVYTFISLILGISLFTILHPRANRFVASIGLNLTYVIAHGAVWALLFFINEFSGHYTYDPNSKCERNMWEELFPWIESPFWFLVFGMGSIFLFYLLIPIWKAKKD